MDLIAVRELYDRTVRADPPPTVGVERTWFDGVLRATQGAHHFIGWWDFAPDRMRAIVAREAARLQTIDGDLLWQLCGHDRPEGLQFALAEAGFEHQGAETMLALEASAAAKLERPPGVDVRPVRTEDDLASYVRVACQAFGNEQWVTKDYYLPRLHDPTMTLFLAYVDGEPAATARLETPSDCPFAGLFDGGVAPQYQGTGLYRAVVADRAAEAVRRGARYLVTDARETSRPILERLGFERLTTLHLWMLKATASD